MLKKRIENSNFLWVTRGEKWGFRYLSKCSLLAQHIDIIYKKIFLDDESYLGYWKGDIIIDDTKYPYIACRCYDNICTQYDEAGRRIPHEFLLLCSNEDYNEFSNLSWGGLLLSKIRNQYVDLFHCEFDTVNNFHLACCFEITPDNLQPESHIHLDIFIDSMLEFDTSDSFHPNKWFLWGVLVICLVFCFFCYKLKKHTENLNTTTDNHYFDKTINTPSSRNINCPSYNISNKNTQGAQISTIKSSNKNNSNLYVLKE